MATTLHEDGTVESVDEGRARVCMASGASEMCRRCNACDTGPGGAYVLEVDAGDLHPGDRVTVEVALPSPWSAIALLLALPLAAFVFGAIVGVAWFAKGASDTVQALAGLAAGVLAAAAALGTGLLSDRRFGRRHPPRVVAVRRDNWHTGSPVP